MLEEMSYPPPGGYPPVPPPGGGYPPHQQGAGYPGGAMPPGGGGYPGGPPPPGGGGYPGGPPPPGGGGYPGGLGFPQPGGPPPGGPPSSQYQPQGVGGGQGYPSSYGPPGQGYQAYGGPAGPHGYPAAQPVSGAFVTREKQKRHTRLASFCLERKRSLPETQEPFSRLFFFRIIFVFSVRSLWDDSLFWVKGALISFVWVLHLF